MKTKYFVFIVIPILILIIPFIWLDEIKKLNHIKSSETPLKTIFSPKPKQLEDNSKKEIEANPLTLDSIFNSNHTWTNSLDLKRKIVLIATGDVIPARSVNFQTNKYNDFTWPWQKTFQFLKNSDLTLINLESPILTNCPVTNEGMVFCGSPKHLEGIKLADIDIVNIANNHYGNYAYEGVEESNQILTKANILISGNNNLTFSKVKDKIFAFLGYNEIGYDETEKGISWLNKEQIKTDLKKAQENSDFIIVSFHWGAEYISQPEDYRIELAHQAIDWGADLIIGNHPHWIQPVEIYNGKIITYAHGNFIFDQEWSQETKEGVIGKYILYDNQIIDVEFIPIIISDYGQPDFAQEELKTKILNNMYQQSQILNTKLENLPNF